MKQSIRLYVRSFDSGQGQHWLEVDIDIQNGKILKQWLAPRAGGNHSYTGNGNPEYVGMNIKELRGAGFDRVRLTENQYRDYLESDATPYAYRHA